MAADDLDFWLGTWDCTWEGGNGRNTVTRELGDRVVVERFEAFGEDAFDGLSVSVPDPATDGWRQTWVDSTGSYWAFAGGRRTDGTFVFGTPDRVDADQLTSGWSSRTSSRTASSGAGRRRRTAASGP